MASRIGPAPHAVAADGEDEGRGRPATDAQYSILAPAAARGTRPPDGGTKMATIGFMHKPGPETSGARAWNTRVLRELTRRIRAEQQVIDDVRARAVYMAEGRRWAAACCPRRVSRASAGAR